jgi:hypothetical protein
MRATVNDQNMPDEIAQGKLNKATQGKLATAHYSQGFFDAAVYVVKPTLESADLSPKKEIYLEGLGDSALLTVINSTGERMWHGTVADALNYAEFKSWVEQELSVIITPLGWFARLQRRLNRLMSG